MILFRKVRVGNKKESRLKFNKLFSKIDLFLFVVKNLKLENFAINNYLKCH